MNNNMFYKIEKCRVCGNENLITVLDLGDQYLSGIFPKKIDFDMHKGPLKLVKCDETTGGCGHVQLEHTFDLSTMYGKEYGYRSGLNSSMINHLKNKCEKIINYIDLQNDDIVVDIAGNDGTFLGFFPDNLNLLSIDPTSEKFKKYFKSNVNYIADFFSAELFKNKFGEKKAKIVTSFSMFYDLEDPCEFARQVNQILDSDGIWVLEQSYMPEMLRVNSFDTVCHEHLSYYGMRQLKYIMDQANFKIIDFEFNDINGGSISMMVANKGSNKHQECIQLLNKLIDEELQLSLDTIEPWKAFQMRIQECEEKFWNLIDSFKQKGLKIAALGASTKGNVTLQTWGITSKDIFVVGDVNPDKNESFTPGTWIPIKDENSVLLEYDVFVILPWHFKNFFLNNLKFKNKILVFPLPNPEVIYN